MADGGKNTISGRIGLLLFCLPRALELEAHSHPRLLAVGDEVRRIAGVEAVEWPERRCDLVLHVVGQIFYGAEGLRG